MSENLKKCFGKLLVLSRIKSKHERCRVLAEIVDDCLHKALKEIAVNTVNGNIKLTPRERRKLYKYKKLILTMAKNKAKKRHRKIVVQSGGFLPMLVPAVAALLGSILR